MHQLYGDTHMVIRNKKNSYDSFSSCLENILETSEVTTWVTQKSIFLVSYDHMFVTIPLMHSHDIPIRFYDRRKQFLSFSVNSLGDLGFFTVLGVKWLQKMLFRVTQVVTSEVSKNFSRQFENKS